MENDKKVKGKGVPKKPKMPTTTKAKADPETAKILAEVAQSDIVTAETITDIGKETQVTMSASTPDQLCAHCLERANELTAIKPDFKLEKIQQYCQEFGHRKAHRELKALHYEHTKNKPAAPVKEKEITATKDGQVLIQEVQQRNIAPLLASGQQGWITPPDLFNALNGVFHFELDPCTTASNPLGTKYFITKDQDGLASDWYFDAFVNSPFSEIQTDADGKLRINKKGKIIQTTIVHKWVEKSAKEHKKNGITVVQIMANRTETDAAQVYGFPNVRAVCFLNKRVAFIDPDNNMQKLSPTFGSMLLIFKKDPFTKDQLDTLNGMGKLLSLYKQE